MPMILGVVVYSWVKNKKEKQQILIYKLSVFF